MYRIILLMAIVSINEVLTQRKPGKSVIANCLPKSQTNNGVILNGVLPEQLGRSFVCQFSPKRKRAVFLGIQAWKHSHGSLRVGVYGVYGSTVLRSLGRLEITNRTSGKTLVCLKMKYQKYAVIISGTPSLKYTVKVQLVANRLQLQKENQFSGSKLFFFSPKKSSIEAQLDVTVRSADSGEAVLRVSSSCDQVEQIDDIHPKKPTMSLTFERQARITVSKVSRPATSVKPLFIGVLLSQKESDKNFTITITTSFNYNYAGPICFIVFVPAIGGVIVALWALCCFRPQPLSSDDGGQIAESSSPEVTPTPTELTPLTLRVRQPHVTQSHIAMTQSTSKWLGWAMWKVFKHSWVGPRDAPRSSAFSYLTCIVGSVFFVGAFQFVYENWNIMITGGHRDNCFYNDLCYRVSSYNDIPFNLMISNLAYVIHGIVLATTVWIMEAKFYLQAHEKARLHMDNMEDHDQENQNTTTGKEKLPRHTLLCNNINAHLPELSVPEFHPDSENSLVKLYAKAYKRKKSFSVGYAFAWALLFEGIFSLTYHLCPTRLIFQFDTAFMFVIAGLTIVSLFNGMSDRQCQKQHNLPAPIQATSFFLFAIVPLYLLNYLGSLHEVYVQETRLLVVIVLGFIVWYALMFVWAGRKVFYSSIRNGFNTCDKVKVVLFCLAATLTCILLIYFLYKDLSNLFLYSSLIAAIISSVVKAGYKIFQSCNRNVVRPPACTLICKTLLVGFYVFVDLVTMGFALYFFLCIPTTDKTATPAQSRNLNKECALLGFYDYHDIWHILSSFALLMGAFLVMYICD